MWLSSKIEISIDMKQLDWYISDDQCLNATFGGNGFKKNLEEIPDDNTNIFKFDLFNNLKEMDISNVNCYSFSLSRFLSLLKETKIERVKITENSSISSVTWLSTVWDKWVPLKWDDKSWSLMKEYKNQGYIIGSEAATNRNVYCISIRLI